MILVKKSYIYKIKQWIFGNNKKFKILHNNNLIEKNLCVALPACPYKYIYRTEDQFIQQQQKRKKQER